MTPTDLHQINYSLPPVGILVAVKLANEFILGRRTTWLITYKKESSVFPFTTESGEVLNVSTKNVQWFYP
jgi:hypothetical protein